MLFGIFFAFWRFMEIITLIPTLGMLAYFVHIYASHNALTPNYILILFIVSVLAAVWAIATLFTYHRTRSNAIFVSFVDFCIFGALIAAVYELRFIGSANCSTVTEADSAWTISGSLGTVSLSGIHVSVDKTCSMLKASYVFGIMNVVFFFFTGCLALFVSHHHQREVVVVKDSHASRHGHRRSSHSSHHSHRSSHSGRRSAYV